MVLEVTGKPLVLDWLLEDVMMAVVMQVVATPTSKQVRAMGAGEFNTYHTSFSLLIVRLYYTVDGLITNFVVSQHPVRVRIRLWFQCVPRCEKTAA
jgi:hypothetical protein